MESLEIMNLLENTDECDLENATKNGTLLLIETLGSMEMIRKQNFCDYSDSYISVTVEISVVGGDEDADITFKNYCIFKQCTTHLNDKHIETTQDLDIVINMYNLI